jgi:hypothetical protein
MRMMMTVSMATEAANAAVRNGKLITLIQNLLAEVKPEAAYFTTDDDGTRTGIIVFDLKQPSDIPGIAEPLFLGLNAKITMRPAMSPQDLAAASSDMQKAVAEE